MRRHRVLIAAIAVFVLAVGGVLVWHPWANTSSGPVPTLADLMQRLDCDGRRMTQVELYARETGNCKLNTTFVSLSTFASNELRDRWIEAGAQFGGPPLVVGDRWLAYCEDANGRSVIVERLGGAIR